MDNVEHASSLICIVKLDFSTIFMEKSYWNSEGKKIKEKSPAGTRTITAG
jgi:hypothetical protein